jgi:hypothetical protein
LEAKIRGIFRPLRRQRSAITGGASLPIFGFGQLADVAREILVFACEQFRPCGANVETGVPFRA